MKKSRSATLLLLPLILWLSLFLLLPYFFILAQAFLTTDDFGKVIYHFNIDSYIKLFTSNLYYSTLARTFFYAVIVACTCILISIPLAYYIAFKTSRNKTILYSLIVLPFWISYIVRAYAWKIILGENGILNSFLIQLHITKEPLSFLLYSNFSTLVCLIYILTPFVAIPIYTSFEHIPKSLVEASKDLGAGSWVTFRKIIFREPLQVLVPLRMNHITTIYIRTQFKPVGPGYDCFIQFRQHDHPVCRGVNGCYK